MDEPHSLKKKPFFTIKAKSWRLLYCNIGTTQGERTHLVQKHHKTRSAVKVTRVFVCKSGTAAVSHGKVRTGRFIALWA